MAWLPWPLLPSWPPYGRVLFGVGSADPGVFATAAAVFLMAMLLAGSLPAMRAMKVDPTRSLRHD